MHLLLQHWSFDPFLIVVAAIVVLHEVGLHHLAQRSASAARTRARRQRSVAFYGGLAVLLLAVASPIDYWSYRYFWIHMMQHLLLMFGAPMLIVAGAPWLVLVHGLPVGVRRRVGRAFLLARWARPVRALGRVLISPLFAVLFFNVVMVAWHLPVLFDLAERNQAVHIWLMHASFFLAGVLFWLQFMPSYPFRPQMTAPQRVAGLFGTNCVMFVLAMAMSLFATHSWYVVYDHVPGVSLNPLAGQQIGAGILWVCGDFWCAPYLIKAIREIIDSEEGLGTLIDRLIAHRVSNPALVDLARAQRRAAARQDR